MTSERVALLFIVGKHAFGGAVDHHSSRVLDLLNDVHTEFLRVCSVAVFQGFSGRLIAQFDEATIRKAAIDRVALTEERHEAPLRRQYARVEKQRSPIFALLTNYEVRGTVMLDRSVDPGLVLNHQASTFFPVVAAKVSCVDAPGPPLVAKVVFVNKNKVSLLQIEKQTVAPKAHESL